MFSGALILMLPPSPIEVVRADMKPSSVKVILRLGPVLSRLGSFLYGLRVKLPAGLFPPVSANIPSSPEISSLLALIVMLPPASVLVAPAFALALSSALSPIFSVLELMLMSPAFPALLVSVVRLVPVVRSKVFVLMLMAPAFPSPVVDAVIDT